MAGGHSNSYELTIFQCKELYIYKVPPAGTLGHRAELWDVENWVQAVSMKTVEKGEDCVIKLFDEKSGSLFAECPVPDPANATLSTAIEPVIDSSRYFVLKLQDRASGRHAFIGIGFGSREHASDFNASLLEYTQRVRRFREAERLRRQHEAATPRSTPINDASAQTSQLSLRPGETMTLNWRPVTSSHRGSLKGYNKGTKLHLTDNAASQVPILGPPPTGSSREDEDWSDFAS